MSHSESIRRARRQQCCGSLLLLQARWTRCHKPLSKGDPCQATEGAFVRNGVPTVPPGHCSQHKPAHRWCHWALRQLGRNKRCCVTVLQLAFLFSKARLCPHHAPRTQQRKSRSRDCCLVQEKSSLLPLLLAALPHGSLSCWRAAYLGGRLELICSAGSRQRVPNPQVKPDVVFH